MECINCTQCIDACNQVMNKLGRAPNLIRYSSQSSDRGEGNRLARARVFLYPILLSGIAGLFLFALATRQSFNVEVLRDRGNPFTLTEDQAAVRNLLLLNLTNRTDEKSSYSLQVLSPEGVQLQVSESGMTLGPGEARTFHISAVAPLSIFHDGRAELRFQTLNSKGVVKPSSWMLIGPRK
jgi:polyferredoxin